MSTLLLTADLACSSHVTSAGMRVGEPVETAMSMARLKQRVAELNPQRVILDLNTAGQDCISLVAELRQFASPPQQIIAFGPHVHEARLAAAREAGCDLVLVRGAFYARLDELLSESPQDRPA